MPAHHLYTDGSYCRLTDFGGWGCILYSPGERPKRFYGGEGTTTNNRMELTAAIEGLAYVPEGHEAKVFTDSMYVIDGITLWVPGWVKRGWVKSNGEDPKNRDLFEELHEMCSVRSVEFNWVRGHKGNIGNEIADQLATKGRLWAKDNAESNSDA